MARADRAISDALTASERRVLDIILRQGPIARADIATVSGLTGASVTRIVQSLAERGVVTDAVLHEGQRGQPTRPLQLRPDAASAVGVYFSHQHLEIGVVDLAGAIHAAERHDIELADPETIAAISSAFVARQTDAGVISPGRFVGIGFALPGDFVGGPWRLNAHAYFPKLRHRDLHAEFAAQISCPVFVENDAASAALGERVLGVGQGLDSFLFVHIGHGVGGGVVLNGQLHRGASGNAGMFGVMFPNDKPRPSGQDLFAHLQRAGLSTNDFPDLDNLEVHSCPSLKAWIRRAGEQLRIQIGTAARLFDPQAIVIGGRLPLTIAQALVAEIDTPGFCDEGQGFAKPRVLASALGPRAGLIGAAYVPISRTYLAPVD